MSLVNPPLKTAILFLKWGFWGWQIFWDSLRRLKIYLFLFSLSLLTGFIICTFFWNWFFFILCGIRVVVCRHWGKISVFLFCFVFIRRRRSSIIVLFFCFFFLVCLFVCSVSVFTVICCWSLTSFKTEEKKICDTKKHFDRFFFVCLLTKGTHLH